MRIRGKEIKKNAIDRVFEIFAPRAAIQRMRARATMAIFDGYSGASKSKRSMYGFSPGTYDADTWLEYERQTLIDRSHALSRDNALVAGIISSNCSNVVGSGLKFQSRVDGAYLGLSDDEAEVLESTIEREFALWSESPDCDYARQLTFADMQELALRQHFLAGEGLALLPYKKRPSSPYGLTVQLIEPERLCNKKNAPNGKLENGNYLYDGVEKKPDGEPALYHVCSDFPTNYKRRNEFTWSEIPAYNSKTNLRNLLHIYKMTRPGQTRGVPYLAPIMELIHNLMKYSKAELDAAVVSALFTVFLTTSAEDADGNGLSYQKPTSETGGSSSDEDIKLAPGGFYTLYPGEDIKTTTPGRPNANFEPYFLACVKQIGVALEIPYEVLLKCFNSSYSASRAALLEAWRFYKSRRQWFARSFCQPIFETFLYEAVASGRISAPGFFKDPLIRKAYSGAEWVGPSQGHINPSDEADAIKKRTDMGLTTMTQETAEYNGGQFERNMSQIKKERRVMSESGINLQSPSPSPAGPLNQDGSRVVPGNTDNNGGQQE